MKKETKNSFILAVSALILFVLWTLAVRFIDVKAIGPANSSVGFATINSYFHNLTGVNCALYTITDWLGLVPIFTCLIFAILGLFQWIKRKKISKVDYSIFVLGGFYVIVIITYLFFEECVINYRPILINGYSEPSYPSSTTLLVLCVMPTASMQLNSRIKNAILRKSINIAISVFIAFMVIGRLVSGVHWFTDIIGGILLSTGLVMVYYVISKLKLK